jgi:hypothetical protein
MRPGLLFATAVLARKSKSLASIHKLSTTIGVTRLRMCIDGLLLGAIIGATFSYVLFGLLNRGK